jgi:Spy/CpxP family protein refolding chaperone
MSTSPGLLDKLAVGGAWSPKLVCGVTLALVFLCGGVAGALVMDFGVHNRQRPPAFETAQGQSMYFERLQKELDLTPAQSDQVKSILNDFWQYYRTVLSEGRTRIEQVLTADQRVKFERLLQEQKGK